MKKELIALTTLTAMAVTIPSIAFADGGSSKKETRLERMMTRVDVNKDGKLSQDELVSRSTERFARADADGNGEITLDEMTKAMERRRAERRAQRMLKRMDHDGDGKVTRAEIESLARKRFALLDANNDGFVEKGELRNSRLARMEDGRRGKHRQGKKRGDR